MSVKSNFSVDVLRPDDQLVLTFDFHNLALEAAAGSLPARLKRATPGDALVVVHFPRQSIGEESFFEAGPPPGVGGTELPKTPPVGARISGDPNPSPTQDDSRPPCARWLVFRVSNAVLPIKYTLPDLLAAISRCDQLVRETIAWPHLPPTPDGKDIDLLGTRIFSAIEAPYRLVLSPHPSTRWIHAVKEVTNTAGTRTELWHTRLGVKAASGGVDEKSDKNRTARAVWSQDFSPDIPPPPHSNVPFRMPLDARDRYELVRLTADTDIPGYTPLPVAIDQFMLSAFGAWLKLHGAWVPPFLPPEGQLEGKLTIEEWRHLMTMGRDHFVRVVYAGYLFPFGFRASLVKISERKFQHTSDKPAADQSAYLRTRMFIMVRQPVKTHDRRDFPFTRTEVKPLVTPSIADPESAECMILPGQKAFWIRTGAGDFPFQLAGTDNAGQTSEWTMPLIYVSADAAAGEIKQVVNAYKAVALGPPPGNTRCRRPLGGQAIAYAPPVQPGDTTLQTSELVFSAETVAGAEPLFAPAIWSAEVDIPAIKQLLGKSTPSTIQWETSYLNPADGGFGNKADVFAQVTNKPPLAFDIQKSGGLVTPDISITALSRAFGPVNGAAKFVDDKGVVGGNLLDGQFAPQEFFPDVVILGGIKLKDILASRSFENTGIATDRVPNLKTVRNGDTIETTYAWNVGPDGLRSWPLFTANADGGFSIVSTMTKRLDGSNPTFSVTGGLRDFSIMLLPGEGTELVSLDFASVEFIAVAGRKVDVAVNFKGLRFHGVLEFVDKLREVLPLDGFNDPPYLDIIPPPDPRAGINVGFTLGIPDVSVGAFTLQNISLTAGFYLPFVGQPMNLHFAFCERQQPFILTVYGLGGGGFFGLDISLAGVTMVEAALEFGASVALNLGVAKGSATIMGGFYYQQASGGFTIACYIRACGELRVLGIISVSCEFYIALVYVSKVPAVEHHGTLFGQAKLTVKVKIAFFSKSVSISMERELAGSDPKFIEQMVVLPEWTAYCDAFDDYATV